LSLTACSWARSKKGTISGLGVTASITPLLTQTASNSSTASLFFCSGVAACQARGISARNLASFVLRDPDDGVTPSHRWHQDLARHQMDTLFALTHQDRSGSAYMDRLNFVARFKTYPRWLRHTTA